MKKILQITNHYYPHIGGTEQVTRDIANVLRNEPDYEVKIICFNEDARDGDLVCRRGETKHDRVDGVEVIRCGCFTKVSSQSLSLAFGRELKKVMDDFRPDVVIFHYPNPFQAHFLLKYKKRDFRLYLYWHLDITKQTFIKKFFRRQNMALIKRMDRVLGATPMHVDTSEWTPLFGDKRKVLPYMINERSLILTEEERQRAKDIREKNGDCVIGFSIGRHIPYKGIQYLIEASKELDDTNLRFYIAGDGELTESLKEQAKGDRKITFLGRISESDRRVWYQACDIICFPSITRNEAFGLALAEGMYFGKPAVTFSIYGSGVNYVNLAGVTGLECPNGDSHAYAEALKKLASDPGLRADLGKAARERVVNNFTEKQFRENILELLKDK